jgi:hypothetical protein
MLFLYAAESDLRAALVITPKVVSLIGILAKSSCLRKHNGDSVLGITSHTLKVIS